MTLRKSLQDIISKAANLGLPNEYLQQAKKFLDYDEYGLSLDTVVEWVYELDIKIDQSFFESVIETGDKMHMAVGQFDYLKSLLK